MTHQPNPAMLLTGRLIQIIGGLFVFSASASAAMRCQDSVKANAELILRMKALLSDPELARTTQMLAEQATQTSHMIWGFLISAGIGLAMAVYSTVVILGYLRKPVTKAPLPG